MSKPSKKLMENLKVEATNIKDLVLAEVLRDIFVL